MDSPMYERFAALSSLTFQQLSDKTGVPVELLMVIREAIGSAQPTPTDLVREDELLITPFIEAQFKAGFRPGSLGRSRSEVLRDRSGRAQRRRWRHATALGTAPGLSP